VTESFRLCLKYSVFLKTYIYIYTHISSVQCNNSNNTTKACYISPVIVPLNKITILHVLNVNIFMRIFTQSAGEITHTFGRVPGRALEEVQ
jgi:hypothetical protein